MASDQRPVPWPPKCCAAAFLARSITAICGRPDLAEDEQFRSQLAGVLGVRVASGDSNPWGLEISTENYYCGVTVEDVRRRFTDAVNIVDNQAQLLFEAVGINTIAFESYEEVILSLTSAGAIVGIGFDYAEFSQAGPVDRATHVVRLSPLGREVELQPNILSPNFDFDYDGSIWVYDDSLEMRRDESLINWRMLIRACRRVDGSLWSVRRGSG